LFTRFSRGFNNRCFPLFTLPVRQEAVKLPDGQRFVIICTGTLTFTGMMADPSADRREGVILAEQLDGFLVFALVD
jgi:hypothetical protein